MAVMTTTTKCVTSVVTFAYPTIFMVHKGIHRLNTYLHAKRLVMAQNQAIVKCLVIFFTILFLLVGFIVTMVGHLAKPFWGPEDDWCSFCREERLQTEKNLKNCRIAGPIFLALGGLVLLPLSIYLCHSQRNANAGRVIRAPQHATTATTFSTSQAAPHYQSQTYGYPQPYGQTFGYGQPSTSPMYPSPMQPPYPQQRGYQPAGFQQPYGMIKASESIPPPPSYESAVGQSTVTPSAPPLS